MMLDSLITLALCLPMFAAATVSTGWIHAWSAGEYPQGSFTEGDVQAIAGSYDPERSYEAPVSTDHKQEGAAFGWVDAVKAEGKKLYVKLKQVPEAFAEAVNDGRFKHRSIELFRDMDGRGLYLKALSFLGVKTPQVKNLEPIGRLEFSNRPYLKFEEDGTEEEPDEEWDEEPAEEDEEEDDDEKDREGGEGEEGGGPDSDDEEEGGVEEPEEEEDGTEDFSDAAQSEIERLREENQRLQVELENQPDEDVEEFRSFCEQRVPPAYRDTAVAVFEALQSDTIQFSHDAHGSATDAFRELIDELGLMALFGEVATDAPDDAGTSADDLEDAVRESMAGQL